MDWKQRISVARSRMLVRMPFFGILAVRMQIVEATPEMGIDTMATDGMNLFVCTKFLDTLKPAELEFVLAHEVMHMAMDHIPRLVNRNARKWNVACDYVINALLLDMKLTMPKCGLFDKQYAGMSADEVYAKLPDNVRGSGGGIGDIVLPKGGSLAVDAVASEVRIAVKQAILATSGVGNMPDFMKRILEASEPVVDWRPLLWRFIDDLSQKDYSWSRPSRAAMANGLYLPSMLPDPAIRHLLCILDTSGSVDNKILASFIGELQAASESAQIEKVTVLSADTQVHSHQEFEHGDTLRGKIAPKGGGGTSFVQPFEYAKEKCSDASCIVYFTDLDVDAFGEAHAPVLWAVYGSKHSFLRNSAKTPFGESIWLNE